MKSKQHEYILKAFLNSSIPTVIRRSSPELMAIDSVIGGYCSQLIKRAKLIELPSSEIISKTENNYRGFSCLILSRKPLDEKHIKRYVYFEFGICNKECILIPNESEKVRTIILDKAKLKNRIQ